MTDKGELSRRALLSSLGIAGGAGAALGGGTAAFFSDREVFSSVTQAGALDLLVEWDGTTSEGTAQLEIDLTSGGSGAETFVVSLPDEGEESPSAPNNPARGWLRTTCPTVDGDVVDSTTYVTVSLYYACDGEYPVTVDGTPLEEISLLEFANLLRNGTHLDYEGCDAIADGCLQSGSDLELRFEWTWDPPENLDENVSGPITFDFDFVGIQCRHNETPTNPFPEVPRCVREDGQAISYISFCSDVDADINPTLGPVLRVDDEGDPSAIAWETEQPVICVVVFWANKMTIYDFCTPLGLDGRTSGIAETNDPDAAIQSYDAESGGDGKSAEASEPCAVADRALYDGEQCDVVRSIKLEYDEKTETWEEDK